MENFLGSEFNLKLEKTMKKYFVYIASAVLMMAACAKEEVNTPVETPVVGETEFISIELNPATRTILDGTNTNWSAGDAVGVYFKNESIGTLTLVEGSTNKFEGEIESALLLGQDKITLKYPADVTAVPTTQVAVAGSFANGAALLEGSVRLRDLRAGDGATLDNKTALLKFTVAKAGDVTFEVGSTKYTVTGCKTDNTYYACVAPASNVSFVARIGGYLSKNASNNVSFAFNKIAELGELPAPQESGWELYGAGNQTKLYKDIGGVYVLKNAELSTTSKVKFHKGNDWVRTISVKPTVGKWHKIYKGNDDMTMSNTDTYDVYMSPTNDAVCFVKANSAVPSYTSTNIQYHILVEGTNWTGLYTWAPSEIYGNFNSATNNKSGNVTIKKDGNNDQNFNYWTISPDYSGKKFNFLFRGNNSQTGDFKDITLNADIPCYSNNGYTGTYSLTIYDIK